MEEIQYQLFTSALLKAGEVFKSVSVVVVVVVVVTFSVAQLMTFSFSAHLQKFNMVAIVVEAFFVTMVDGGAVWRQGKLQICSY